MEFRTTINIPESLHKITYSDAVMFIGSCFASEIGSKMTEGCMPVMINPAGTIYNPVSVADTLKMISARKLFNIADLYCYNEVWLSFSHYTNFSSNDPEKVLEKINSGIEEASAFLKKAKFLFITFGTSWIFRLAENGRPVSNCHKLPASFFTRELLTVAGISEMWNTILTGLHKDYPGLKIIFTISPVRHWKDGAHGNQVSKSTLLLSVEELLKHPSSPDYFPAYEIMMDELRDYRFCDKDMLHPSESAVEYIWEAFSATYLDRETTRIWKDAASVTRAMSHRLTSDSQIKTNEFARNMLRKISVLETSNLQIDLKKQRKYFEDLLSSS